MRWSFRTIDYSGEFIELATKKDATAQNLKTDVRAWLSKCDAVLFFVGLGDSNLREKLNELNVFITELLKLSGKKNALTIPVGLVLTKWDIQGPISYDPETEDRRVLEFVNSDQKFKEIAQTIRNCGDWVKVFPVSAFGAHRLDAPAANPLSSAKMPPASSGAKPSNTLPSQSGAKMLPASSGAKPFNILPPLVWAAEQASALRSKRFIKKVKLTAACLAIAACLCAWNYSYDTTRYANARDLLLADGSTPEQVQSACAEYNEVISPFKSVLGRSKEISQGFKEFNDHTALNLAYERANSEPTLAHQQAFVQSAGEFFAAWPQSRHTLQIRDRHAEVYPKLLAQYYEEYLVFRKNNDDPDKAELRIEEAKKLLQLLKDDPHSIRVLALISADEAVIRQRSCDRYLTFRANNAGAENAELRLAEGRKLAELLKDDPLLGKVQPLIAEDEGILKTLYFDNFVAFRTANKGPEKADLRVQEGEKLIEKLVAFKDTSISDKVSRMVAEDQCVAKIQRESQAIISNLNAAQAESGKAQNAVQKLETLLVAVGKVGADSNYNAEAQTAIKLFRESIVQVELEADDYRFASAQTSAQTNPDNADLIEQAYLDYLKYGKRHVDAARAELAKLPDLRDRLSWTGIAEYSQQNKNVATAEVFRKLVEKASDYQRKFPKGRFVKEAEDLISATNARHDEYDWKQANIFIQRNEGAYDRQIDKLEAYIHRGTPCVHKDEARKIIGQIEITWDRHEYGKVRDAIETARSVPRGANIKAAYDIANGYLESGHPLKAKTRAVREFVNWFDSFKIPRNIKVKVLNAVVEKGGRVDDAIFGGPDCSIRITLNGTACRTKQIEDSYTPAYNEELGPYSFSWRRQKVEVRIIDQDPGPSTDEAYGEAEDEFVIGALNGAFEFKCDKGKKITVYLECKDALLPTMPNY